MEILYSHSSLIHNTKAAEVIVPFIFDSFPCCNSVLDVGCGTGTWLNTIQSFRNIDDFLGIDGEYVDKNKLRIAENKFQSHDLRNPFSLGRTFDLLLCLEVAEHLPESCADQFIETLCSHSRVIVFSAAIPWQGGQNHLNEQWSEYWRQKFRSHGYSRLDFIRPKIWNNETVDVWYRQNLFVYTCDDAMIERLSGEYVTAEIHPGLWRQRRICFEKMQSEIDNFEKGGAGIARSFKALVNAVINRF